MKGLHSKEHYCYKVHASPLKGSAYSSSIDALLYGLSPPSPHFRKKIFSPTFYDDFSKISIPYK